MIGACEEESRMFKPFMFQLHHKDWHEHYCWASMKFQVENCGIKTKKMSSFLLLDDCDLLETAKKQPKKGTSKRKKPSYYGLLFPVNFMDNVLHTIFLYLDINTLYSKIALTDKKRNELVTSYLFCQSILMRDFNSLISGEEEKNVERLLCDFKHKSLPKYGIERLEPYIQRIDPNNEFRLLQGENTCPQSFLYKHFTHVYQQLVNRRICHENRTNRLRIVFGGCVPQAASSYDRRSKVGGRSRVVGVEIDPDEFEGYAPKLKDLLRVYCDHFNLIVLKGNPLMVQCHKCGFCTALDTRIFKH